MDNLLKNLKVWAKDNIVILIICMLCIFFASYSLNKLDYVNDECNNKWIEQLKSKGIWDKYNLEVEYEKVLISGNKSYDYYSEWKLNNS